MKAWDEIFRSGGFPLEEPHRSIAWLCDLFKKRTFRRVCDLGCGTGRNLVPLASNGFEAHGIDLSAEGLRRSRRRAGDAGTWVGLVRGDMKKIPYASGSFDAVICIYAIYQGTLRDIEEAVSEIHRVLRRGGLAYVTFQTLRSHKYGQGRKIEDRTFVQDHDIDCSHETGIPHHFSSEDEVRRIMRAFRIVELELEEFRNGDGVRHSHWQVLAEKG
ncbi:MAG: class I SAM-dependent methyltransferase [Candidatus Brockarchaeota archaeon]|nr:class I SAM-dependent methyltransferase [Candidatus Brockarchaeota archaeon]